MYFACLFPFFSKLHFLAQFISFVPISSRGRSTYLQYKSLRVWVFPLLRQGSHLRFVYVRGLSNAVLIHSPKRQLSPSIIDNTEHNGLYSARHRVK
jgi:hypothetical protein